VTTTHVLPSVVRRRTAARPVEIVAMTALTLMSFRLNGSGVLTAGTVLGLALSPVIFGRCWHNISLRWLTALSMRLGPP
jgi:hypothetical protein